MFSGQINICFLPDITMNICKTDYIQELNKSDNCFTRKKM